MARKDDPVFNVRFVQFVENQPCLWNYTHPGYSKKEEVQRAWQQVANDIKDTVRNCRERWRTIRSSFLRSLKLERTQTGRGKRKYYLSKYMQFLVPFTKSRSGHKQLPGMVLRKPGQAATIQQEDEVAEEEEEEPEQPEPNEMPLDVQMSEEEQLRNQEQDREPPTACLPLRLQTIKVEKDSSNANQQLEGMRSQESLVSVPAASLGNHLSWSDLTPWVYEKVFH
ncbi:GD24528 [Drosophila simulans]|uniref:GD24528 n=1 Tax=Drosophila simulans TaxID=7240 RepID=B4NUC6_DROSI|nr:GD24528 [Drosophila simulans]